MFMRKGNIRENFTKLPKVSSELETEINLWDNNPDKNFEISQKCEECMNQKYGTHGHLNFFVDGKCLSETDMKNYTNSSLVAKKLDDCLLPRKQINTDYAYLVDEFKKKEQELKEKKARQQSVESFEQPEYLRGMYDNKKAIWKDEKLKLYIGVL